MTTKRTDHRIARAIEVTRASSAHTDFIAIVRALAKRHAREDHAAEIARHAPQPASE